MSMMRNESASVIKWNAGMATMRYNYRRSQRYFMSGRLRLEAARQVIEGSVVDISLNGAGFLTEDRHVLPENMRRTWLCTLSSPDLPVDIRCLVRMVRRQSSRIGSTIGCVIVDIDRENLALLKAYRALALARGNPRLS